MTAEERLEEIEKTLGELKSKRKDGWDKLHIVLAALLPLAIAFSGYIYSNQMKKAEIAASERQAQAQIQASQQQVDAQLAMEKSRADLMREAQKQQHDAELAIAKANSRVGQAGIISNFITDLVSSDLSRRKIAIEGIMIAMPDDGASIVAALAEQTPPDPAQPEDPAIAETTELAIDALSARRKEIVYGLVSESGSERSRSYDELISRNAPWATDPKIIDLLLRVGEEKFDDKLMVYHIMIVLRDASRLITQPRKDDINAFCEKAAATHPTLADEAEQIRVWLNKKR